MINIVTGLPGSGKTYFLAMVAKDYLNQGAPVYSNFWLADERVKYFTDFQQLRDIHNGIILCDEMQVYFNSRSWESLGMELQYKLQQHRKDGLHIWGSVQHPARLDVVLRELVNAYYEAEIWFHFWVRIKEFYPEDIKSNVEKRHRDSQIFRLSRDVYKFYDTLQKIPAPTELVRYVSRRRVVDRDTGETIKTEWI